MKHAFPHFYGPTEDELSALWQTAMFVFDTSSLLNLYGQTPSARKESLGVMEIAKSSGRLWIPYQVGLEFLRNRGKVAQQHRENLLSLKGNISTIEKQFGQKAKHLEDSDQVISMLQSTISTIDRAMESHSASGKLDPTIANDQLFSQIEKLFSSKDSIGKPLGRKKLRKVYRNGPFRYDSLIPPGFEDQDKGLSGMFGDLIAWEEIVNLSKKRRSSVILVIDDKKEDWTYNPGSKDRITHPQLRNEFQSRTGQDYWSYGLDEFLSQAKSRLNAEVSEETIEEAREVRRNSSDPTNTLRGRPYRGSAFNDAFRSMSGLDAHEALLKDITRQNSYALDSLSALSMGLTSDELRRISGGISLSDLSGPNLNDIARSSGLMGTLGSVSDYQAFLGSALDDGLELDDVQEMNNNDDPSLETTD